MYYSNSAHPVSAVISSQLSDTQRLVTSIPVELTFDLNEVCRICETSLFIEVLCSVKQTAIMPLFNGHVLSGILILALAGMYTLAAVCKEYLLCVC